MNKKIQHIRALAATTAAIALLMLAPTACVNNIPGYEDPEANNPEAALDPSTPVTVSAILNAYGTATPTRAITRAEVGKIPALGEITALTALSTSMGDPAGNIYLFGANTSVDSYSAHGAVNDFALRNSKSGSSDIELHISDFNIHPTDDNGNKQAHSRLGMADFTSGSDRLIGFANRAQNASDKSIAYKFDMRHTTAKVSVIVMDIFGEPIDMSTALNAEKSKITTYDSQACVFETESDNRNGLIPYMTGADTDGNYPSTTALNAALATTPVAIAKEHKLGYPSSNVSSQNLINVIVTTNPTAKADGNQFPAIDPDEEVTVDGATVSAIATGLSADDAPAAVLPFNATEGNSNPHRITIALNAYDAGNNTPGTHAINLNDIVLTGLPEGDGRRGNSVDEPSNGRLRYLLPGEHVVVTLKIDRNKLVSATANLAPWIEANASENEGDSGNEEENGGNSQLAEPFADLNFCAALAGMGFNEDGSSVGSLKLKLTDDGYIDMSSTANRELISKIKELDLYSAAIKSLKGIEYFTSLTHLDCYNNYLNELDLSSNTKLVELYCGNNSLTTLDLSNNTELTKLNCYYNSLTTLDVSHSTKLEELNCYNNQLTALNVSNNTALTKLDCDSNPSTAVLNVSNNTELTTLDCNNNGLTALDVSNNTKLTELNCSSNGLTALDVTLNTELTKLICYSNKLAALNVSNNTKLTNIDCYSNQLAALDVTLNKALTTLDCNSNELTSLLLGDNTNLTTLNCRSNQLTELDVTKNINLAALYCYINQLTTLDVSNNTALKTLNCSSNQITTLDVTPITALNILSCHSNRLAALDARKMVVLSWTNYLLYCGKQTTDGTTDQELALNLEDKHKAYWENELMNDDEKNNSNVTVAYGPDPVVPVDPAAPTAN